MCASLTKNKPKVGLETEMFTIDSEGHIVNKSDNLFKLFEKDKKLSPLLLEEMGTAVIEMGSNPENTVSRLAINFLDSLKKIVVKAQEKDIHLLPLACHPAKYDPTIRSKEWYNVQEGLYGKEGHKKAIKICGFHFHYSLPKGVVEKKHERIKRLTYPGVKDVFLNIYNFSIAAEPAFMTFLQSSPFFDGIHYGKDCRTLVYRDMAIPDENFYGLFHNLPILGGLPHYEFTLEDLRDLASRRKNLYLDILRSNGFPTNKVVTETNLKFVWGPIRVNKIGTLEFRGFDMNTPMPLFSTSALIEEAIDVLKKNEFQALPSDLAVHEPFKIEDNIVHLPPYSMVKSMELLSSRYGFENSFVQTYCSALINFVKKLSKGSSKKFEFLQEMLDKKRTTSDEILHLVKKNGYHPKNVPEDFLNYLAAYYSRNYEKEIDKTIKFFSSFKK